MSDVTKENKNPTGFRWVIPFFLTLGLLTVCSFIIPLRPAVSYSEKRELAKFPEFSWSALVSGDYFDDITLWFSDTFPGRETWMTVSDYTASFHGYAEIAIVEDDFMSGVIFPGAEATPVTTPSDPTGETAGAEDPADSTATEPTPTEDVETEPTQWGGVDGGNDAEIAADGIIQIGDTAFNRLGFDSYSSERYTKALSKLGDLLAGTDVRVISSPIPLAISVLVEPQYLAKLKCARQDEMLAFMHDPMSENVVTIDTFSALSAHNDEYIYFRTDHHWTALGAYYVYEELCKALDMEPASLDSFEVLDQGQFRGTLYGKARWPHKLKEDNLVAYIPQGDITMLIHYTFGQPTEMPLIQDRTNGEIYGKYMTFLCGDHPLTEITNDSIPDAPNCVIIKDSFGNCFAPFLTQNYHKVYVLDYRHYHYMGLMEFVETYDISDIIFLPYMMATQSPDGAWYFEDLCK